MGLLVFSVVKLCKYHQQENIRVSMAKERKRLIKEDLITEVPRPGRDNPAQVLFSPTTDRYNFSLASHNGHSLRGKL